MAERATNGYALVQGQPRFPTKGIFVSGRGQYDGFFAGPVALAKLQQGQVLDEDSITHIKTVVTQTDDHTVTMAQPHRRSTSHS